VSTRRPSRFGRWHPFSSALGVGSYAGQPPAPRRRVPPRGRPMTSVGARIRRVPPVRRARPPPCVACRADDDGLLSSRQQVYLHKALLYRRRRRYYHNAPDTFFTTDTSSAIRVHVRARDPTVVTVKRVCDGQQPVRARLFVHNLNK